MPNYTAILGKGMEQREIQPFDKLRTGRQEADGSRQPRLEVGGVLRSRLEA